MDVVIGILGLLDPRARPARPSRHCSADSETRCNRSKGSRSSASTNACSNRGATKSPSWPTPLDAGSPPLLAQDRERERFLAIVAHELKTPMTSIWASPSSRSRPESAEVRARALGLVRSHASRLGRLIDDLLLAASTRSGALPFRPQSVDAAGLTKRSRPRSR